MTGTDPAALAAFIGNQRAEHHVPQRLACRVLGVSESWFYKWRDKPTSAREVRRGQLADAIRQIFEKSGGTYGSPKVWLLLIRAGWRVSVNTVARLMAELGLAGRKIRCRGGLTRPGKRPAFADLVRRDFTADASDQVWCGDMTEIATGEGKLYLATVIDLFSRRLLGYAMGARHDAELVVASLNMAAATRGGDVKGVIFHSDRGSPICIPALLLGLPASGRDAVHGPDRVVFRQAIVITLLLFSYRVRFQVVVADRRWSRRTPCWTRGGLGPGWG
ncbi:IS3 family transposase [Streptomyces sp. NPDC007901]|uniref:IS3 family transposase n=1 Tax=Streptomyces sp. NPDC007901 TaxID=3364785 RepID=UPI0036E7E4CB